LVVLVLVVLWIAVLSPRVIRHFRESRSQTSIESFHEQLHLLERTGPKLVTPAYRLDAEAEGPVAASAVFTRSSARRSRPGLALLDPAPVTPVDAWAESTTPPRRVTPSQRRRGRRRRRDIVFGLTATAVITGSLGAMHSLHMLWAVAGAAVLALLGYVALAAYVQMLDADHQALKPVAAERPVSPWAARRPRHAAGEPLFGVELLTGGPSQPWAARAGYPGAWDDEVVVSLAPRHAAGG
jgi:hypothetical protein